jgi:2-C-methyl-D-erythritol 2,4-cyclodiphosphate synthase
MEKMYQAGWEIINLDNTIVCQAPKLFPYIPQMVKKITDLMNLKENQVSIKATTTEGLGFVGRNEGIAVQSVVLLYRL